MSVELQADEGAARPSSELDELPDSPDRERPNVSGDLPTVFQAAPMFRRAVAGYDRFQVDTYVQWAEEELVTADRQLEHLITRNLRTGAALDEARQELAHSGGGREFLQVSRGIGTMLAVAADEAERMRTEAHADRCAATAEAARLVEEAGRALAEARAEAERTVAEATSTVEAMTAAAERTVEEAAATLRAAAAEAEERLAAIRRSEQRAADSARAIHRQALEEADAVRSRVRHEVVAVLSTGREERRRADAQAAAVRERLDREALASRGALLAEIDALQRHRTDLRAEVETLAQSLPRTDARLEVRLRRLLAKVSPRPSSLRAP